MHALDSFRGLSAQRLLESGNALLRSGQVHEAIEHLAAATNKAQEESDLRSKAYAESFLGVAYLAVGDYPESLLHSQEALLYFTANAKHPETSDVLNTMGCAYRCLSEFQRAIECFEQTLELEPRFGDLGRSRSLLGNLSSTYQQLGQKELALRYASQAEELWPGDSLDVGYSATLSNFACLLCDCGDYVHGLISGFKALQIAIIQQDRATQANMLILFGENCLRHGYKGDSLSYLVRAIEVARRDPNPESYYATALDLARLLPELLPLSSAYHAQETLLVDAIVGFQQLGNLKLEVEGHDLLSKLYEQNGQPEKALPHVRSARSVERQIVNSQAIALAKIGDYERKIAYRERELKENAIRQEATEAVLRSMLPAAIADKLIGNEDVSEYFDSVSILFADIVAFTRIALNLKPQVLVSFLNTVFGHFDTVMEKYGCQRLKTVGDGYIAVCGMPARVPDHTIRISCAAVELLQDFELPIDLFEQFPSDVSSFSLRIGIHTGPVIAGLVGARNVQYDIYGDAVNVASRMESHGVPDAIQCSELFKNELQTCQRQYPNALSELLGRDDRELVMQPRGIISVKGLGLMATHLVELRTKVQWNTVPI